MLRVTATDDEAVTGFDEVTVSVNASGNQGVVSFTLINAATNQPIAGFDPISNGTSIDFADIGTDQLSIRANTITSIVGSVVFNLQGFNGGGG